MSHAYIKRATKEFKMVQSLVGGAENPWLLGATLPNEDNVMEWHLKVKGSGIYEAGVFLLSVVLTEDYPHRAPKFTFITQIHHPSIATDGKLCEGLVADWAATSTVAQALANVVKLFDEVEGHEVLNDEAARQYAENRPVFDKNVVEAIKKYAV